MNGATPAFFAGGLGPLEITLIVVAGLLIFGRRLPDVARSVGKSIVEFKKGIRDVKDEVETQARIEPAPPREPKGESELPGESASAPTSPREPTSAPK